MSKTDETSIRLDVINFCAAVSRNNCDSCADQLLTIIERGISDSFYKIVSESFRVLSLLVAKVSIFYTVVIMLKLSSINREFFEKYKIKLKVLPILLL